MILGTNRIVQALENRSILVTGAAGFIAKIFIEKMLRVQPNVKKLYLLLRASGSRSATQRFNSEIIGKELFRVAKDKYGSNWSSLIDQKIMVVAGDITRENLGIQEPYLLEEMWNEVDVVANIAATTNFDERYDVSIGINTLGVKHVLDFAKRCDKLKRILHVSTAYVSGEMKGVIDETPYSMGETLNGSTGLDIDNEINIINDKLKELMNHNTAEEDIKMAMKDLGIQRAKKFGWPNTYVFTKAMGEMVLGDLKQNIHLAIVRPTTVTSTYAEPFPGWIEGLKTNDSLALGFAQGKLTRLPLDPEAITDVIPADMVVNAMMVATMADATEKNIFHVGSSFSNPVSYSLYADVVQRYFTKHPWVDKNGNCVNVRKLVVYKTMERFKRHMTLHYVLPLKGMKILNCVFCQCFDKSYHNLSRKVKYVMRMMHLFEPYLFFKGVYDDTNTEILRQTVRDQNIFYFDPRSIEWEDYYMNIHLPGLVKYVFK